MKMKQFATNLNGTDETGIVDLKEKKIICLCTEEQSKVILEAFEAQERLKDQQPYGFVHYLEGKFYTLKEAQNLYGVDSDFLIIHLYLRDYCDESLPFSNMIAEASRKVKEALTASEKECEQLREREKELTDIVRWREEEIERLKESIEQLETEETIYLQHISFKNKEIENLKELNKGILKAGYLNQKTIQTMKKNYGEEIEKTEQLKRLSSLIEKMEE